MGRYLLILLLAGAGAYAGNIYMDGRQIDTLSCRDVGADLRCVTTEPDGPVDPPVEPPDPPVQPPSDCPATQVPIAGTIDLDNPGAQQLVDPRPWVAFKIVTGADITGQFSFGNYQGSDSILKTAAVTTCPIISNDYLVATCYASGSSTVNLGFSPGSRCSLQRNKTYYLMYGAHACGSASCRSVMRIY